MRVCGKKRSQILFNNRTAIVLLSLFIQITLYSQPANDNCPNATVIPIPSGGFGLGTFTSLTYDLTQATIESGETFAPAILVASLNSKSMWYKFSIPTTRAVKVTLAQPGTAIAAGNAGFAVYKTNTCLPNNTQISSKLTPLGTFGNTFHPCVEQGDYLIQVTGNNNANGPLYIQLQISDSTGAVYDHPAQAYDFGTLSQGIKTIDYGVDCQSIDDATEVCTALNNSSYYNKTTWHVFKTPAYFDYLAILLASPTGAFPTGNTIVGYKLYQGDARTNPVSTLPIVTNCDSFEGGGGNADYFIYKCTDLQSNTTYSIQLFFKDDFNANIRLAISLSGTATTQAPEPILSAIPASNILGVLPSSPVGIATYATDNFGCNSRHIIHPCSPSLPGGGINYNVFSPYNYNLSTFFTFTLSSTSNLNISANTNCWPTLVRLYKQGVTNTCSTLDTINIVSQFQSYNPTITCLDPGNYTLQVSGSDSLLPYYYYSYFYLLSNSSNPLCILSNLGRSLDLTITTSTIQGFNHFSLSTPGAFDTLNAVGGIMQPLSTGIAYTSKLDTFGCANTVLPEDTACFPVNKKAMYREFKVNDSGFVYLNSFYNYYYSHNKLYKGDANALAIAQSVNSYPQKITGLTSYTECLRYNNPYALACVVPGTYTYITFGDSSDVGRPNRSWVQFDTVRTIHNSLANAEDMGDILNIIPPTGGSMQSSIDHFSCYDNAITINGYAPCDIVGMPATKAIYRQFYLNSSATISISSAYTMTLFSGKATNGIAGLTPMPAPWQCFTSASSTNNCLPTGWYTLVSYGTGPSYSNPLQNYPYFNFLGASNVVNISACPGPKYNRPHKAAIDTLTNQPFLIQWASRIGSTSAYTLTDTTYNLYPEYYNCTVDTPFLSHPILSCDPSMTRVTYYVFKTTQESYIQISTGDHWSAVYSGDVRFDSATFATSTPIQPCVYSNGNIQLCRLQPGTYTLVIFTAGNSSSCSSVVPMIYIDKIGYSRFDHANNAYDFGTIPPDNLSHYGKVGDINPLDAGRAPSNDFIYCTTGSQPNDPTNAVCGQEYNPNIYAGNINNYLYPNSYSNSGYSIPRRNLWYTFVLNEGGNVKIKVSNKTINKYFQYRFAVFKSDVDGTLPFSTIASAGQVDSTINQGLTFITLNQAYYYCWSAPDEITFYRDPCTSVTPERYYILVENSNSWPQTPSGMYPNSQVEVSITLDPANAIPAKFDHYSFASNIGTSLGPGTYTGQTDNYSCATKDNTDPIVNTDPNYCKKTLWYKFSTSVTGQLRFRININNGNYYYVGNNIQLLREIIPGDSTSTGLQNLYSYTYGIYDNTTGYWSQGCIYPGTYYLVLPGCNQQNEYVFPEIQIIEQVGDFCSNPVLASLNGASSSVSSVIVDCHTIGTDYGEFNPTLSCPDGGVTTNYKTSWFKIHIDGVDTVDVTTFLTENTNAQPADIKYRLMNGDCGAMQERSCVQDAQTQDTYKCLPPGDYYVQVFTPITKLGSPVNGNVDLHLNAVPHVDTCAPINNCFANANFIPQYNCSTNDSVTFVNYSTYGSTIQYHWDFGYAGQTSAQVAPKFSYPASATDQTYNVTLTVLNTTCGADTVIVPIIIPARPQVNLGNDTTLCNGNLLLLNATSWSGATYFWQDGSTNPTYNATAGNGVYFVRVTYNGCSRSDTIRVNINPITPYVQNKILCGNDSVQLNSYRGAGETYLWNIGSTNSSIYVSSPGTYINYITWNSCTIRDSFFVYTAPLPFAKPDTTACYPLQNFSLDATVPGALGYSWQNGSTSSSFNVNSPGLYWVQINYGNCINRDSILVTVSSPATSDSTNATICAGQSYTLPWGTIVSSSGVYRDTLYTALLGCDSLYKTVRVNVQASQTTIITATACAGQTYTLPWGVVVSTAGIYKDTLHYNNTGCDSLYRTVNLTFQSTFSSTVNATICSGQTYTLPWGTIVTSAGIYKDTIHYINTGCDSLYRTVNLAAQITTSSILNPVICAGQTYTLPWGTIVSSTGVYRDTLYYNNTGCDSLYQIVNLTAQSFAITTNTNATICSGQTYTLPWGTVVSISGTYTDTARYINTGCDSLYRVVNLTVQSSTSLVTNVSICSGQSYTLPWGTTVSIAGLYKDTLHYAAGCDSLYRTVNLTVQSASSSILNPTICSGQTYTLPWGAVVSSAGVYKDTLRYSTGCDSLYRTVNLTIQSTISSTLNPVICSGQTYTLPWGTIVSTAGIYKDTLRNITGCDSLYRTVNLIVQSPSSSITNASICSGQTYSLPWGAIVSTAGIYKDTLYFATGCDSLYRTVDLTAQSVSSAISNPIICSGQTYTLPWGAIVSTAGIYKDTLRYASGCDSLYRTVNLTVQSVSSAVSNPIICSGQTYTLPWGTMVSTAGIYKDTLRYATSCDSLYRTVNLTVQSAVSSILNPNICSGQTYTLPWGPIVSTSGIYKDTVRYTSGCDSLYSTVNLTIQPAILSILNPVICLGQTYTLPWGPIVSAAGIYKDTLRYAAGCDSLYRTVNLAVQSATSSTLNPTICSGQTYTLPWGIVVASSGIYKDTLRYATGCDSMYRTVNLTMQSASSITLSPIICSGQTYTLPWGTLVSSTGIYQDTLRYPSGCDSLYRTVNLTIQPSISSTLNPMICSGQTYTLPWGTVVASSGVYRDTLHYTTGCDSLYRTVNLTVQSATRSILNPIICSGQTYTLPWGISVASPGVYKDTLHYTTGCDSVYRTVNLAVQTVQTQAATNAFVCSGQAYTLPWGTVVNSTGIYRDTIRYNNTGCDSLRRSVNLTVQSSSTLSNVVTLCQGQSYILPWGISVNASGLYKDTLRYATTNCDSVYRIINLSVIPAVVSNINASICSGEVFTLPWGINITNAGIYKDTIRTSFGCDSLIRNVNLSVRQKPSISVTKSNDVDCMIGVAKLNATGGTKYVWSPASSLSNPYISNPVASPTNTTIYNVLVTAANGCINQDSIKVIVNANGAENGYLLPNAFTPNGDGKNDCFGVRTWGNVTNLQFEIYNRWGQMVFACSDPSQCWDGTYKGEKQSTAVFVYQVWAETICGKVYRKGTVTLIR